MNFDELMKGAWQVQVPPASQEELVRKVRQRQLRLRLLRSLEVVLTLLAVFVFGQALLTGRIGPSHWLLMPFFVVFLPVAWAIVLRAPRRHAADATGSASAYARLRLAQLRAGLRDLRLARTAVWLLAAYAVVACAGTWLLAGDAWRDAGLMLLLMAGAFLGLTLWLGRPLRRRWLREYRSVRRLIEE